MLPQKPFSLAIWQIIIYFWVFKTLFLPRKKVLLKREKGEFPGNINKLSLFVNRKVDFEYLITWKVFKNGLASWVGELSFL